MINKVVLKLNNNIDVHFKRNFKHPAQNVQAFFAGETYTTKYKPLYGNMAFDIQLFQTPQGNITLNLSFCPAKVLFGNNLFEVQKKDFKFLLHTVCNMLGQEGWEIDPQVLRLHPLSGIDYAKIFASIYDSDQVLGLVDSVENHRRLTKAYTRFPNDGKSSAFQYKHRRLYIYDKTKELLTDRKLAQELQMFLVDSKYTFFRWEYNMRFAKEIQRELEKQGIYITNTFENLFDEAIGQQILSYYISEVIERMKKIDLDQLENTYYTLAKDEKLHGSKSSLSWLGYHLGTEKWGVQGVKKLLLRSSHPTEVNRTLREYRTQKFPVDSTVANISQEISQALSAMTPIQNTLSDLQVFNGVFPIQCPCNTAGEAHA